ncbi:MerR family transcriptional regulator [Leucobacter chromiireducens]|uniref:MerR family transcriptional regulator n=1 Tax=Leucobacter chromiireducens subsp. chromiireducens TaxID=660067 RepID=A0ABS1SK89_9MICO|nr:TipAS antibiotic-recognition domain-containing protein [Leucobacter chromiireducens]MBL3688360.1 MerR family transcriptional regulator [Leucobacter chromiireducens subsp. chromiireducens]
MERSIQEVARAAGTTSRTLRHYDRIGLLPPSRIGANRYRFYDDRALVRLQRVLLLRGLGLGLDAIAEVLAAQDAQAAHRTARGESPAAAEARILGAHLELLRSERDRIDAQIGAVERTVAALTRTPVTTPHTEGDLMSEDMFAGFDHAQHRDEVAARWGEPAAEGSERWWNGLGKAGQGEWMQRVAALNAAWIAAVEAGEEPGGAVGQELAARHVAWLRSVPGTPAATPGGDLAGYVRGLGAMYVADERFAANYGGIAGATFVRDALDAYIARERDPR